MAANKQKSANTNEVMVTAVEETTAEATVLSDSTPLLELKEYLAITEINPGLIASFKAESQNDSETPRTAEQWRTDFNIQSNRAYI